MLNHKQLKEDSATFFNKEVDKIIHKVINAKTDKLRIKYINFQHAKRIAYMKNINKIDSFFYNLWNSFTP